MSGSAVIVLAGLFVGVLAIMGVLSGWPELARHYKATQPMAGRAFWFRSARIGLVGFRSCLVLNAEHEGLGMRCLPALPILEPALLLPWSQLEAEFLPGIVPEVALRAAARPGITIKLSGRLFEKVLQAAGRSRTDLAPSGKDPRRLGEAAEQPDAADGAGLRRK